MSTRYVLNWQSVAIILGFIGLSSMLFPLGAYRENTLWCGTLILVLTGCILVTTSGKPRTQGPSPILCIDGAILIGSFLIGSLSADFSSRVSLGPLTLLLSLPILVFTRAGATMIAFGTASGILFFIGQKVPWVANGARLMTIAISIVVAVFIYQAITQTGLDNSY